MKDKDMAQNKNNDWKDRLNVVYSTSPNFEYETVEEANIETLPPEKQLLKIALDKKQRKGKIVTLVQGFVGAEEDLKALAKQLKSTCGTGGTVKNAEIIIQGDFLKKINDFLLQQGYKTKMLGK